MRKQARAYKELKDEAFKQAYVEFMIYKAEQVHKHLLFIFAVNRELHKKTTPELALHIITFLTHFK